MTVIAGHAQAAVAALVVVMAVLTAIAIFRKEDRGYSSQETNIALEDFKINYLKAIVPIVPLALLIVGSKQIHLIPEVTVPQVMLFGTILSFVVTRVNPQEISKQFFTGMGEAYGSIIGIIIAAAVFTKGMELIGLTGALIEAMKHSENIARLAATFGPFIVAVLSGSGDAATLAFNGAITPHAEQFGFGISQMGSQALLSGGMGRSMSPVAGAAIVCAQLAGVNTIELAKRNAPGMILATIVTMLILT